MAAYYNEIEPYAAQWLRNLIAAGHIADGVVDERDIRDVSPAELPEFTQCHFFAGIGIWSHALRQSGWRDEKPVWTGSCPCQPFSAAGKGDGFDDERHLWPHWHHLIAECGPHHVFGEQVASKDGLGWFDLVSADMEATGYTIGAADICAAGLGAPHIRQRLWFVAERLADPGSVGRSTRRERNHTRREWPKSWPTGQNERLGNGVSAGLEGHTGHENYPTRRAFPAGSAATASSNGGMANDKGLGLYGGSGAVEADRAQAGDDHKSSRMADTHSPSGAEHGKEQGKRAEATAANATVGSGDITGPAECGPGPTNGFWSDADWLFCRDGKWRPVESGTFPLADGITNRVGRLRAYGNAIVPAAAQSFIEAYLEARR